MGLIGFQTLHCPKCDKTKVVLSNEIVWQEGKGSALRPSGYFCLACQDTFDVEGAMKKVKTKELAEKIKELEAANGR